MPAFRRAPPPPALCEVCRLIWVKGGKVCSGCRVRKHRGSAVAGGCCQAPECYIAHPRVLRRVRFRDGATVVLCANHAALAGRRPLDADAFLGELALPVNDRRQRRERRAQLERRFLVERRQYAEPVDAEARQAERRRAG